MKSPCWLSVDQGLGQFGKTEFAAQAAYLHFMGQTTEEELLEQLRHGTKQGRILGNEDFIKGALKQNKEKVSTEITIEQIVDVVAKVYQVSPMELTSASRARHPAEARAIIALIGMDHCDFRCQILQTILTGICHQ